MSCCGTPTALTDAASCLKSHPVETAHPKGRHVLASVRSTWMRGQCVTAWLSRHVCHLPCFVMRDCHNQLSSVQRFVMMLVWLKVNQSLCTSWKLLVSIVTKRDFTESILVVTIFLTSLSETIQEVTEFITVFVGSCRVSAVSRHVRSAQKEQINNRKVKTYELPDGNIITVDDDQHRCPNVLLRPRFIVMEASGMQDMSLLSVTKSDVDIRKDLFANVVMHHHEPRDRRTCDEGVDCVGTTNVVFKVVSTCAKVLGEDWRICLVFPLYLPFTTVCSGLRPRNIPSYSRMSWRTPSPAESA